jgi:hypothetical protein
MNRLALAIGRVNDLLLVQNRILADNAALFSRSSVGAGLMGQGWGFGPGNARNAEREASTFERRAMLRAAARGDASGMASMGAVGGLGALPGGAGLAAGIGILGAAAAAGYGIAGAAGMQKSAIAAGIAGSTNNPQQLYAEMLKVSGQTAQSTDTIGREYAMASSSGMTQQQLLQKDAGGSSAFERMAKAADVLWMSPKNIDPVESIRQMTQLAHLFGAYKGAPLQHMLDRSTQLMYLQPEALQNVLTQGKYVVGQGLARGVSEEDMFDQILTMGQTGLLRGRGGSGLARVMGYLTGGSTVMGLGKPRGEAMTELGLVGKDGKLLPEYMNHGNLLLGKVVDHLEAMRVAADKSGHTSQFANLITNAFLQQGGSYLNTILNPATYAQSHTNIKRMDHMGGVDSMWAKESNSFMYQFSLAMTNLGNVFKAFFLPMLPELTSMFKSFGEELGQLVNYISKHPQFAKDLSVIFAKLAKTGFHDTVILVTAFVKVIDRLDEGMNKLVPVAHVLGSAFEGLLGPLSAVADVVSGIGNLAATPIGKALIGGTLGPAFAGGGPGGGSSQRQAARMPGAQIRVSGSTRNSPRTPAVWSSSTVHG